MNEHRLAHATLAGVYDPHAAFEPGAARSLLAGALGDGDALGSGPLAAFRSPSADWSRRAGAGALPPVFCLLAGRLYNTDEVREAAGLREPVEAETAIAELYRREGVAALQRLSGSFALVLWDSVARRGLLVQDQLGTRALYYAAQGGRLYFATDVAPLLRLLPTRPAPDDVVLVHKVSNSNPPLDRTVYEGVRRLCGAHLLELDGGRWERRRYWEPRYSKPAPRSADDLRTQLWEAVSRSVRARMLDSERVGIIMSGGLDSSTVATAMMEAARGNGRPVPRGYSAVFPSYPRIDESDRVNLLADGIGIPSVQIEPHPMGILRLSLDYLRHWEIPVTGPGYLLERPLMEQAAADGIAALLDGQGGDEVFGMSPYLLADRIRHGRLLSSFGLARRFPLAVPDPPLKWSLTMWKLFGAKGAIPYAVHEGVRRRIGRFVPDHLAAESARIYAETENTLAWKRALAGPLWWRFKAHLLTTGREETYLPEYLRHRAAMVGIEARPPLLDLRLVEFALSTPPELDFDNRYDRPNVRETLRGRAPEGVRLDRRKSNLSPFYQNVWLADIEGIREVLLGPDVEVRRFLKPGYVEELLRTPPAVGDRNWSMWGPRLWGPLAVECFLQHQRDPGFVERLLDSPSLAQPRSTLVRAPA